MTNPRVRRVQELRRSNAATPVPGRRAAGPSVAEFLDAELEPETEWCPKHGAQLITDAGSNPGFTGAPVYWWTLACGCTQMDGSADNLGAVR